ncbi:hypothetical protein FB472_0732 [Rhodoglobus vestalii]|uniref:Uncharacterized protein n=1 Tax=Rhodoglobus vestalii TaxID=193384 RepID=A0A8H2PU36_9MICO|nr:hypothetical protein FB472_0732 [Rhodoglobus vestalii]
MPVHQKNYSPEFIPVLAAGRHRSARKGGCFMEFASYLAGEKWSDHPPCTHPALALLARLVNDCTSDGERSELAELIPSVIGLTSSDPRVELLIALRVASAALPIASEERQRALAVGIIATHSQLANLRPLADTNLTLRVASALAQAPLAERWARKFVAGNPADHRDRAVTRMTNSIIRTAVLGIAQACSPGTDASMRALLRSAIEDCRLVVDSNLTDVEPQTSGIATPTSATYRLTA